jgi:hypothetical protein
MNNNLTIGDAASVLIGAGLAKLDTLNLALILIGVGVVLKVAVAVLNKEGIQVEDKPPVG